MTAVRPHKGAKKALVGETYREFRELLLAAVTLRLYGEDVLASQVQQVAMKINDGTAVKR